MKILNSKVKLLFIMFTIINFGCQDQEDVCYSCDKNVDSWAHENKVSIQNMDRADIATLSGVKQRAAFRVLTPMKRQSIWINKLEQVKEVVKTNAEKQFIAKLITKAEETDFNREWTDEEVEENTNLLFNAATEFEWGKSFIVYAFGTLQNIDLNKEISNSFFAQETVDCNCRWGWCPDNSDCETSGCDETNIGCGLFNLGSCTKRCGGDPGGGGIE